MTSCCCPEENTCTLQVPQMNLSPEASALEAAQAFATHSIPSFAIDKVNWPESYPYKPAVTCQIAYSQTALYLQYHVEENAVLGTYEDDETAHSWENSCVEFFVSPFAGRTFYYNFETTCIGTCLMACGDGREARQRQPESVTSQILREASLGRSAFGLKEEPTAWTLTLVIPWRVMEGVTAPQPGSTMKANFYKCGDNLPVPHFLSWAPIGTLKPDFHRPEFFGTLQFQ